MKCTTPKLATRTRLGAALILAALAPACGGKGVGTGTDPNGPEEVGSDFESTNPGAGNEGAYRALAGDASVTLEAAPQGATGEVVRAIEEADIFQLAGNLLYAMSRTGGLSIIDVSNRDQLTLLGRFRMSAEPFEMYVRDNVVLALFTGWGTYEYDEASDSTQWVQTSQVVALDVASPSNVEIIGEFSVPGDISDSRIVGDVLYVVGYQDGYCWRCANTPQTSIVSLNVASPTAIEEVDRLAFVEPEQSWGYGRRSVTVTTERMYVSGPRWSSDTDNTSTIQVVDISDPAGDMVAGATLEVEGMIESRWQMDEQQQILRVISQPPSWSLESPPIIQTYEVVSSQDLQPLGRAPMTLPRPEQLRSVRFDSEKAYAITFERTDPLFTIDLSDPSNPRQVGELEIPGWVYHMEPRGDRIFALGFDTANADGALNVSLFDVSDFANPALLDRVNFGGDWGSFAEDQDRIHKAFTILDDLGLIFVPYGGYEYETDDACYGRYRSGVQLINFTADTLTLRGVAPQRGEARRAFLHDERMFTVSEERVQTFDITDRDRPSLTADLPIAMKVNRTLSAGDHVLRFRTDWWSDEVTLEVVSASAPDAYDPLGRLDLMAELEARGLLGDECYSWRFYDMPAFVNGTIAYLLISSYDYWTYDAETDARTPRTIALAVDFSDPAEPAVVDARTFEFSLDLWSYYTYSNASLIDTGTSVVQLGSTVVVQHTTASDPYAYYEPGQERRTRLEFLDFSDPTEIRHAGTVIGPQGLGHTGLIVADSTVMSTHWRAVGGDLDRVRFYVDRVDVANPHAPEVLPSVNVPGSVLSYDPDSQRLVTVDYQPANAPAADYTECYADHPSSSTFDSDTGRCQWVNRTLHLVALEERSASLLDTEPLDEDGYVSATALGDDCAFLVSREEYYGYAVAIDGPVGAGGVEPGEVRVTTVAPSTDELVVGQVVAERDDPYFSYYSGNLAAQGTRLVLGLGRYSMGVVDAADVASPTLEEIGAVTSGYGYVSDITIHDDVALCSLDAYGLEVVDLP